MAVRTEITSGSEGRGEGSTQNTGSADETDALARQLSDLARDLEAEDDPEQVLARVVAAAVALVPGADEGSISAVAARRHVRSESPSGELAARVDALQDEVGQGPCLDAVFEQETVRVPDLTTDGRWPRFTERAAAMGVGSMLSFQLYVEGDNLGALNMYSREPGAFDDESEHVGLLFATHAAIAYADVRKLEQLRGAMVSRDVVGMAKGILIERHKITPDQAFMLLTRASQNTNRKLHQVADDLVHSGELAAPRPRE